MNSRRLLALVLLLTLSAPALAHKLKVFATVEAQQVQGYAFFVGGGRARGTSWTALADDQPIASGETDNEGRYAFLLETPPQVALVVRVDTQEGHTASITLDAARFGSIESATPALASAAVKDRVPAVTAVHLSDTEIAAIEAAVQRQVTPLLERIEEMDARLRTTDILSGLFLIIGLAGLWFGWRGRRP